MRATTITTTRTRITTTRMTTITGHDHGHDHDHEHAHDHGNELSLEGMSDDEIREIQAALLAELQSLQAAYDAVQAELNGGEASE